MSQKEEEKSFNLNKFVQFIIINWYVYVLFAAALIVCIYTIYNVEDYQQKINNNWMIFINDHCSCSSFYVPEHVEFKLKNPVDMIKNYGVSNYNTSIYFVGGLPTTEGNYLYGGINYGIENLNNDS